MYRYDEFDHEFVNNRVAEFTDQVNRRLTGNLSEEEFRPLRLMNGLYLQLHAYMLRVAIPYGTLSSRQMLALADISEEYDRGYGHFTTRQNIQFNWPALEDIPKILKNLAKVEMHALQTSGNCIRNITSDPWAGVTADEIIDPRPICELLRQWSSLHPEFAYLPRKFKFAVTGATQDRAAIKAHDIGIHLIKNHHGELGCQIFVGGGQGRSPFIAKTIVEFIPYEQLLPYVEAMIRVYNLHGRRDNKYKSRIKILLHDLGLAAFKEAVDREFERTSFSEINVPKQELERIEAYFLPPNYAQLSENNDSFNLARSKNVTFHDWCQNNLATHKVSGYAIVNISLKPIGGIPGDITAQSMRLVAKLADDYSGSEIRATHRQNLVLPNVKKSDVYTVWQALKTENLAEANLALATDIIACPGMDYCSLATARSIPIAQNISKKLTNLKTQMDVGKITINISGCINACGHHHVGNIGILGLDKKGQEYYQLTLGGNSGLDASIGTVIGPGFSYDEIPDAVENILQIYLANRTNPEEEFLETFKRMGIGPFKEALYATT